MLYLNAACTENNPVTDSAGTDKKVSDEGFLRKMLSGSQTVF
jgi:hypothetical protein